MNAGGSLERRVEIDRVRALYRQGPLASFVAVVMGALILWVLWTRASHAMLAAWYALVLANQAVRIVLWWAFRRAAIESETDAARWAKRYMWNMAAGGVFFGAPALVFFPADPLGQTFLLIVIAGMAAGSITANAFHPQSMIAYLVPLLGQPFARLATLGGLEYGLIAFSFAFYLAVIVGFGRNQARLIRDSIAAAHEKEDLVEELREKRAAAEAAQKTAEQASLAKSQFFAAARHDLRPPLHALGLYAATLREGARQGEDARRVDQILSSVDVLESLFDELLDISRLDAGYVTAKPAHASARQLLAKLESTYAPLARRGGLELRVRASTATVHADPVLLERVLGNLLSNAIRYTERGGVLTGARRRGAQVALEVWDTGSGIPAAEHERVFDEFYQLANPERDRRKGLGLGLATVKRIADLSGWRIELRSRPGRGTLFRVLVPAGDAAKVEVPAAAPVAEDLDALAGKVVAVVEDESAVREGMSELLQKWRCRVVTGGDAEEARRALESERLGPDLIVADYRLREHQTGIQAIRLLRQRFGEATPAVLISGDTAPELFRAAKEAGLVLLHKPVQPARLRAAFTHLVVSRAA